MLNFQGLGFSFGAIDRGLSKFLSGASGKFASMGLSVEGLGAAFGKMSKWATSGIASLSKGAKAQGKNTEKITKNTKEVEKEFSGLSKVISKLNDLVSLNKLGLFIESLGLHKLNKIADGIQHIGSAGENLTTGYEAQLTALHKTAVQTGVDLGYTGKALKKFTAQSSGMAIGLNIDAGQAGEAIYNFTSNVETLGAVGIKSAKDFAKFTGVLGIGAGEFATSLSQIRAEFNNNDDALRGFVATAAETGKTFGNLKDAYEELSPVLGIIREKALASGQALDPKQLADFGAQIYRVAGAMRATTKMSLKEAMDFSKGFTKTLVGQQQVLTDMSAGIAQDIGEPLEHLGVIGGDVSAAFDLMNEGPQHLMEALAKMVQASRKDSKAMAPVMGFLGARLKAAFGDDAQMIMKFMEKADDKTLQAMSTQAQFTDQLKTTSKAYTDGRTLAERYQLVQDQFVAKVRAQSKAGQEFVRKSGEAFKDWGDKLVRFSKDDGPIGAITRKLIEMHQLGLKALIPEGLQPLAAVLGKITEEVAPLIGMIPGLVMGFTALISPVGLLVAPLLLLGGAFLLVWMKMGKAEEARQELAKNSSKLTKKQRAELEAQARGMEGFAGTVVSFMRKGFSKFEEITKEIPAIFSRVWPGVVEILEDIPWDKILNVLRRGFHFVVSSVADFMAGVFKGIFDIPSATEESSAEKLGRTIVRMIKKALKAAYHELVGAVAQFFEKIWPTDLTIQVEAGKAQRDEDESRNRARKMKEISDKMAEAAAKGNVREVGRLKALGEQLQSESGFTPYAPGFNMEKDAKTAGPKKALKDKDNQIDAILGVHEATNNPAWFGIYHELFGRKMDQLHHAIKNSRGMRAGGGPSYLDDAPQSGPQKPNGEIIVRDR